jgi:hypothetical protein
MPRLQRLMRKRSTTGPQSIEQQMQVMADWSTKLDKRAKLLGKRKDG